MKYEDKVICTVSMQASHLLFRHPWQFDRRVKHDGFISKYLFTFQQNTFVLRTSFNSKNRPTRSREIAKEKGERNRKTERDWKWGKGKSDRARDKIKERKRKKKRENWSETRETKKSEILNSCEKKREKIYFYSRTSDVRRVLHSHKSMIVPLYKETYFNANHDNSSLPSSILIRKNLDMYFLRNFQRNCDIFEGLSIKLTLYPEIYTERAWISKQPQGDERNSKQVLELMEKGHVRESMSPCAVPVLLVPKPDGK